uniref:Uncharacterized protein n=1 Tax=Podarcis muralis TaxID=64176 RepID=A0A670K713_PODMU
MQLRTISLSPHFTVRTGWWPHCSEDSSDQSVQSGSPSHTQFTGMQVSLSLLHWNSPTRQVGAAQPTSSLPSLQSSCPFNTRAVLWIQLRCESNWAYSQGLWHWMSWVQAAQIMTGLTGWPRMIHGCQGAGHQAGRRENLPACLMPSSTQKLVCGQCEGDTSPAEHYPSTQIASFDQLWR